MWLLITSNVKEDLVSHIYPTTDCGPCNHLSIGTSCNFRGPTYLTIGCWIYCYWMRGSLAWTHLHIHSYGIQSNTAGWCNIVENIKAYQCFLH
ncbi:hypothetical protein HID58_029129 [Brassica napus]|uniref:BnaA08g07410D protein n=3 Tax=Brassica TaxID=3705 RepID=A0A078GR51_BRANA|nr:hypothetical protein HID58_029129 [Brassica napus]CAF2228269.1 unnamed protein product [Brassica napus]CAG7897493.1 unnamed protein product [Brassica rapa]CDY27103.1 BnaA08g07410D [Brassica napus]VDD03534.1 unnamed protein product [Brassica rapa]